MKVESEITFAIFFVTLVTVVVCSLAYFYYKQEDAYKTECIAKNGRFVHQSRDPDLCFDKDKGTLIWVEGQ